LHYVIKIAFNILNPEHFETQAESAKMLSVIIFINALINGYYLGWLWPAYAVSWMQHTAFISGSFLLGAGFVIQITSNAKLLLGRNNEMRVLNSGIHKLAFCPSYFGEALQWSGFALMTWCAPAAAAFCWMLSALFRLATAQKNRYLLKFPELPPARKAFVPFIL
jgi:steroid 5-alpha reductase family enzyme